MMLLDRVEPARGDLLVLRCAIINPQSELLLVRRSKEGTKHNRKMWELPGGKSEGEQDPSREVREETGLILPSEIEQIYQSSREMKRSTFPGSIYWLKVFLARIRDARDVVLSDEHDRFWWMPITAELPGRVKPETIPVLEQIRTHLATSSAQT
jgi:8-oxo-dGTP pyrophosphatase MutT (NUDIX family)